jgi:glycosyltransferase involved in cell wall biosynthesis
MSRFFLPDWVRRQPEFWLDAHRLDEVRVERLRQQLTRFRPGRTRPAVSIVIPAYNEERTLLQTLASLAAQRTRQPTELLVANNNSRDRTQELLDRCGVRSLFVREQGVAFARQEGLEAARGEFVANADSDCLYPPGWVDALTQPLRHLAVSCTYGSYSFLPGQSSRLSLGLYELASERAAALRRPDREFINVLGYNFAFRRADALAVGGFNTESGHRGSVAATGRCEDGWMALSLLEKGRIQWISSPDARVWTSPRRLEADGSLQRAFLRRARREVGRLFQ